jgi:hypothetical protein
MRPVVHRRFTQLTAGILGVALTALLTPVAACASPAAEHHRPGAFVQDGVRADATPSSPPRSFVQRGVRNAGHAGASPSAVSPSARPVAPGALAPADPPEEPTVDRCKQEPSARVEPGHLTGWYINRYGWCGWGHFTAEGTDARTGTPVGTIDFDFVFIASGNRGARQFDYYIELDNITTSGEIDWPASVLTATFQECADPQPESGCLTFPHSLTPDGWKLANYYATTFTNPEQPNDTTPQIATATTSVMLAFATPTQPEWVWAGGATVGETRERYDSATYVPSPRGAVFLDAPLVFTVDYRDWDEDESARHIWDALHRPYITLPSWSGKSVPSRLTRMYNEPLKKQNRDKSVAMCAQYFGKYDGTLVNCDEYPFASTYEGAVTGPLADGGLQRNSVRLIDWGDNQYVGNLLGVFYGDWRILDGDKFDVAVDGL